MAQGEDPYRDREPLGMGDQVRESQRTLVFNRDWLKGHREASGDQPWLVRCATRFYTDDQYFETIEQALHYAFDGSTE